MRSGEIAYVCESQEHIRKGRDRADGTGHITLHDRKWAYCAAGEPTAPHAWRAIAPVPLDRLKHDRPPMDPGGTD
jgi:hypothetical protein